MHFAVSVHHSHQRKSTSSGSQESNLNSNPCSASDKNIGYIQKAIQQRHVYVFAATSVIQAPVSAHTLHRPNTVLSVHGWLTTI